MNCITYSIKDVSVILGVSVSSVYNLISDGVIPYVRVGGRYMIPINEFENVLVLILKEAHLMSKQKLMGCVSHRKDGRWVFVHSGFNPDGSKKPISKYFKTKAEAVQAQKDFTSKQLNHEVNVAHIKLSKYLYDWLDFYCRRRGLAQNTIDGYEVNIRKHIIPSIGYVCLDDIDARVLDKLFSDLDDKGLSSTTQLYVYHTLHKAFATAVKRRDIPYNYCDMIEPPKKAKFDSGCLHSEDLAMYINYLDSLELRKSFPILISVTLGLRRGEVLGLKWSDFQYDNSSGRMILHVQRTLTPKKGGPVISDCKTDKSNRYLLLPSLVLSKFDDWRCFQDSIGCYAPDGFLFQSPDGGVLSATTLNKWLKKSLSDCGLDDMRFHDLRHSFASYLVEQKVPINTVSQMLGHSKVSTTADIYLHADFRVQSDAVSLIDSIGFESD